MDYDEWALELTTRWMARDLECLAQVSSTNSRLRDRLQTENVPLGAAVVADEQTAGRGRLGRAWWSPAKTGIYTSFLVYPGDRLSGLVSLLAAVALCQAIEVETGLAPRLKWPNDVLLGGKKCTGILVESSSTWAIIGMGVNVNGSLPPELAHVTTLSQHLLAPVHRPRLWAKVAGFLEQWYERWLSDGSGPVLQAWRERSLTVGQTVEILRPDGRPLLAGLAVDVDDDGALLVKGSTGKVHRVVAGEVSLRFEGGAYNPPSDGVSS